MELVGVLKNYHWGKLGADSAVAQLHMANVSEFQPDATVAYAELWMGSHPSGPSKFKTQTTHADLSVMLKEPLPFLFKVLSIRQALSIQVHPNKADAERLHKERPNEYQDDNHKPEIAIALTPFMALCGFRPYEEILQFCESLPPLKELLGGDVNVDQLKNNTPASLKAIFESLMISSAARVEQCIKSISKEYENVLAERNLLDTFKQINADFPNDVGVLCLFFLNLVRLQPGQAIFLGANEIHAYLSGDCIECMACSDNVIRAGLTPKYKDVHQLIACLNYAGLPVEKRLFSPVKIDDYLQIFVPPVSDFAVSTISLPPLMFEYLLQIQAYGAILIVLEGERVLKFTGQQPAGKLKDVPLKRGSIVYIPPEAAPEIAFTTSGRTAFKAYMAMYNYFS